MENLLSDMLEDVPPNRVDDITAELEKEKMLPAKKRQRTQDKRSFFFAGSSSGYYLLNRLFPKDESAPVNQKYPKTIGNQNDDLIIERSVETNASDSQVPWRMPPKGLVDYIIQMYFDKMNHPLPIFDKEEFYEAYNNDGLESNALIPTILHMCTKVFRVIEETDSIFKTYNVEKQTLKADLSRQLYNFHEPDFLEPKLQSIQTLLSNSAHCDSWFVQAESWIASGMAIKMAQDLGLHRSNSLNQELSRVEANARKRLWWSAYIIDRFVCASVCRPLTISDADCDIEYPDEAEYTEFAHSVRLASILGDAIKTLRSPKLQKMAEKNNRIQSTCRAIQQRLDEWRNNLPLQFRLTETEMMQILQLGLINPKLNQKLNDGAGQFQLGYVAICLLLKKHLMVAAIDRTEVIYQSHRLIRESMCIISTINLRSLLCFWCFTSYFLSEALGFLFLTVRSSNSTIATEAKSFCEDLKRLSGHLEKLVGTTSIIPYIDVLLELSSGSCNDSSQDPAKNDLFKRDSLVNSIDGMEWNELAKLLMEADAGLSGEGFT